MRLQKENAKAIDDRRSKLTPNLILLLVHCAFKPGLIANMIVEGEGDFEGDR